jgi:hypothetical protein
VPQIWQLKRWALQAAEKLYFGGALCQGTTSVVPQTPLNKDRASAPEGRFSLISPWIPCFSAASLAPEEVPFESFAFHLKQHSKWAPMRHG